MKTIFLLIIRTGLRLQLAFQRPALLIHAGKDGLGVAITDVYAHCFFRDDANDTILHRLQRVTFDNDFHRLIKPRMVMGLAIK